MKTVRLISSLVVVSFLAVSAAIAAPVESVESARASVAFQKVDAFLSEQAVVDQLAQLGITSVEAKARLAGLSDTQVEQIAAQIDLLQAGGTIQGTSTAQNTGSPLICFFRQIGKTIAYVIEVLFCWNVPK